MANPSVSNAILQEQVRVHGEMLARLTVLVEEDHKDLGELKDSVVVIAKAVAAEETRDAFKARLINIVLPILTTLGGVIIGHFLMK